MTIEKQNQLIGWMVARGTSLINAKNEARGPRAEELYKEYSKIDPLDAFISFNMNKPVDVDGKYGNQCVDLMRAYCRDVLGFGAYVLPTANYAYQIFRNFPDAGNKYFSKVYNKPWDLNQKPPKGAILFWKQFAGWGTITGVGGHVAINKDAGSYKLLSFDQNWPTRTLCHLQVHSYTGLWGWLVPKKV